MFNRAVIHLTRSAPLRRRYCTQSDINTRLDHLEDLVINTCCVTTMIITFGFLTVFKKVDDANSRVSSLGREVSRLRHTVASNE